MNEVATQFAWAVFSVHLLNILKKWKAIPWINTETESLNRFVAFMFALLGSLGFHFALNGTFTSGGVIQISFPPADTMLTAFVNVCSTGGFQQMYFRYLKKSEPGPAAMFVVTPSVTPSI